MQTIMIMDYQKRELDELHKQDPFKFWSYPEMIGHLLNVYKVCGRFYKDWRTNEEETQEGSGGSQEV